MNNTRELEVINGAILSDLSIYQCYKNQVRATLGQNGSEHIDWVVEVAQALLKLGVIARCKLYDGDKYPGGYCHMHAGTHPFLRSLYGTWYSSGHKEVPQGFTLTPVALAHWFMGDGSSTWKKNLVLVKFSTQGFSIEGMNMLTVCLADLGIYPVNVDKCGKYHALYAGKTDTVIKLMDTIEPFIVPSYRYKIKRPELKSGE